MRTDKDIAVALRKQGKSYKEISKELKVAVSTLSNWFKGTDFSEEIRLRLTQVAVDTSTIRIQRLNNARGDVLSALYEGAEIEAIDEIKKYRNNPLFIAAVATYWGEGDKRSKNHIRMTNTDPAMLRIFIQFLTEICKVPKEKIRIALFIYNDLEDEKCKMFWSNELNHSTFHKTMVLPSRHKSNRLPYGICTIVVSNSYLKKKMTVWIDHLPKIILNRAVE